jgi:phosphoribosylamine--glycine ligase
VLSATAAGPDLSSARDAAYALVGGIRLRGGQFRTDIAAAAAGSENGIPATTGVTW